MTRARDLASTALNSTVNTTELGYLDGVTSSVQTQLDAKAPSSTAVTLTGTQTLTNKTLTSPVLTTPTISTVDAKGDLLVGTADNTVDRLAVGNSGDTIVADSSQTVGLRYNPQNSKANCFINGGMDIWQRSTSASATQGYVAADRWITYTGTSGRTYSRQTGTAGIPYALRCQRDSGQTTTNGIAIGNAVEIADATPYQGKTVTISFYARAGANYSRSGSTLGYAVTTGTGTTEANGILSGYTGQSTATSGTVTLTTSFQRFAFSFTFGASITQFNIELSTNTLTGTAGANDWFEVTGVQMDLGTYTADTAPTFRRAGGTIQGELAACQRYFNRIANCSQDTNQMVAMGRTDANTAESQYIVRNNVTMRGTPSLTVSAAGDFYVDGSARVTATSITGSQFTPISVNLVVAHAGISTYASTRLFGKNSTGTLDLSAEL